MASLNSVTSLQRSIKENVDKVKRSLAAADAKIEAGVAAGLKAGGLFIQRESQEIVPVDFGPLRASAFTRSTGKGFKTEVRIGYTAAYAVYVHENLNAKHGQEYNLAYAKEIKADAKKPATERVYKKKRPQEQAKFLESVIRTQRDEIVRIVRDVARRKIEGG